MTHGHEQRWGVGMRVVGERRGKKWDNCNSIINKIYLKKLLDFKKKYLTS